MSKPNKEEILGMLNCVIRDCEVQVNALESREDVSWDCYDVDNWANMSELLKKVKSYVEQLS